MSYSENSVLKRLADAGPLFLVMLSWGLHLGFPMHRLQNIRGTLLGQTIPIYYLVTVLLMAAAAIASLTFKRRWLKWEMIWWALPLICLPGVLFSGDPAWSLRQWLSWCVRGIIPGGVMFLCSRPGKPSSLLLYWVYPVVIAASLLGLSEVICKSNPVWDGFDWYIRATSQPANPFYRPEEAIILTDPPRGTQGNRIPYASTLVGFLPIGLWLLRYEKRHRAAQLLALGALFSILILAQVRSAWVAALVAIVLMRAIGLIRTRREFATIAAGALLFLGVLFTLPRTHGMIWQRMNSFHLSELSIGARLAVLETARAFSDHWLLGVGFGLFPTACRPYYHGAPPWLGTADNQYFRWALENGIPSLMLLFTFFAGLTRAGWKHIARLGDDELADYYKSILVGWLSVAVTFVFFDGFYWGACSMTFWSLLGLFATSLRLPPKRVND